MPPSPEYELLLDAIVPRPTARADLVPWGSREWGQALRIADWHRLSPLLYCYLASREVVPGAVRSALERAYLAATARSLFIRASLARVLGALDEAEVPAIPLKGAGLLGTAYPDPAQREMLDLDILVPEPQLAAATAALGALGYRGGAPADRPGGASTQLTIAPHHDAPLIGDQQLLAVELHRHVTIAGDQPRFAIDEFWQRAGPAPGGAHRLLAPEDMLLHVCLHFANNRLGGRSAARHTGGALAQICDIARIVEHLSPDWDLLCATSSRYGLGVRVFLGLFAAQSLGVAIPAEAVARLAPRRYDRELGRRVVDLRVLRDGDHLPPRTLRWMFAPSREVLSNGWNADPNATRSLAGAYLRRARAHVPEASAALRRPLELLQDRRLNDQIRALENRT
jgi:hypothetical protein